MENYSEEKVQHIYAFASQKFYVIYTMWWQAPQEISLQCIYLIKRYKCTKCYLDHHLCNLHFNAWHYAKQSTSVSIAMPHKILFLGITPKNTFNTWKGHKYCNKQRFGRECTQSIILIQFNDFDLYCWWI